MLDFKMFGMILFKPTSVLQRVCMSYIYFFLHPTCYQKGSAEFQVMNKPEKHDPFNEDTINPYGPTWITAIPHYLSIHMSYKLWKVMPNQVYPAGSQTFCWGMIPCALWPMW